jgi:cell division protein FtsQ
VRRPARAKECATGCGIVPQLLNLVSDLLTLMVAVPPAGLGAGALVRVAACCFRCASGRGHHAAGPGHRGAARVRGTLALRGNFFTVDLEAVKETFEKLPWVRKAEVRRRWPDAHRAAPRGA